LEKGHIAVLSPRSVVNAVCYGHWAGKLVRNGRQTMHTALTHRYGATSQHIHSKVPLLTAVPGPVYYMIPWTHMSYPPNGISTGSAVFAQITRVPNTHTQTDRQTHKTRYMPHL